MYRALWLLAFLATVCPAQNTLEINSAKLTVRTAVLEARFERNAVTSLKNRLTGEEYVQRAGPSWFEFLGTNPASAPFEAGVWVAGEDPGGGPNATITLEGGGRTLSLTVAIAANDEIALRVSGKAAEPGVVSVTWGIFGLDLSAGRLVIPGQAGTYFDAKSTPPAVGLDYPVHWEHQMVIYEGRKGSMLLYSPDSQPRYQRVHASRQTGALDFAIEMFAAAPFAGASEVETREWRLAGFAGDWRPAASRYKEVMDQLWPPVAPAGKREWIREIRGVVAFLVADRPLLERVAREVDPARTLIHFADWRKHGFDLFYPENVPSAEATAFIQRAHELGFRVMLHINVLGISEVHPQYQKMKRYQMRRGDNGAEIGWLWDEFPSGHPRRVAYITPASAEFRELLIDSLRPAIESLAPDAIHLDAGGALINDANGLVEGMNSMEGMIRLHRELLDAFPGTVFGGESTNEIIGPYNWLAQRWPADSPPHPVGNFLMAGQLLFYGFLDQPSPDDTRHHEYLRRYEGQGVLPMVVIASPNDLDPDRKRTLALLRQFKRWQAKQYAPDWDSPWDEAVFRFRSADGASSARIEAPKEFVELIEDDNTVYRRVRGVNSVETPHFIDHWPAYDENRLLGLDPALENWLTTEPHRPKNEFHLTKLPENYKLGVGTLMNSRYGYVEIEPVQKNWFDFVAGFAAARSGTLFDGKDYPLANGAVTTVGRVTVGGEGRAGVLIAVPPNRFNVNGATFIEYKVPVPVYPSVWLSFEAGIADGPGVSDGALFGVQINGTTLWRHTIAPGKWMPGRIDLKPYAGTTATLRFLTNAGERQDPRFDLACWASVKLDFEFHLSEAVLDFGVPASARVLGASEGAVPGATTEGKTSVRTSLPARFALFLNEPPRIGPGDSLLSLPSDVWKTADGGLPFPFSVQSSGSIEEAKVGGVVRAATLIAVPPRNGSTLVTFAATVDDNAHAINVDYGLVDPPENFSPDFEYSGVEFSMRINGEDIFSEEVRTQGWRSRRVALDQHRGKRILVQLKTNAQQNQLYDWARWSNLTVQ